MMSIIGLLLFVYLDQNSPNKSPGVTAGTAPPILDTISRAASSRAAMMTCASATRNSGTRPNSHTLTLRKRATRCSST
jgi:hypothetical protein